MTSSDNLKKTSLNAVHRELGARMVDFGGWDMPVQYSGLMEEHKATRSAAGLFDVSHMGEIVVTGEKALDLIQLLTPNDASKLTPGRIQYSALTTEEGTFVDDILVYCRSETDYLVVVNASNIEKDFAWMNDHAIDGATIENQSDDFAQIAIQGPLAEQILQSLVSGVDLEEIAYYRFKMATVGETADCIVSRTGYTGEDGFEIYLTADGAPALFKALLAGGEKHGIRPCGLGARDTLRLEAKLPLYGNDIDNTTTVIEAGLGWIVKTKKGDFIGRDILVAEKEEGVERTLVGFEMIERGIARHGYPILVDGKPFGEVTSGTHSPVLGKAIGVGYLPTAKSAVGTEFAVEVRNKAIKARVVETPFVPHQTKRPKRG